MGPGLTVVEISAMQQMGATRVPRHGLKEQKFFGYFFSKK
jgi:hypothetical protein